MINELLDTVSVSADGCLICLPEYGMAYHTAKPMDYGTDYWMEFRRRDDSPMGEALTQARLAFVRKHLPDGLPGLVDVGIGGGRFVVEAGCKGYDVNPTAIGWLKARQQFRNPYDCVNAIACWDSLEHIEDPSELVACVNVAVFVSLPIFDTLADIKSSRHYKPGEHIWYWTHNGFVSWMERQGFILLEANDMETQLGREGIMSYAFVREHNYRRPTDANA